MPPRPQMNAQSLQGRASRSPPLAPVARWDWHRAPACLLLSCDASQLRPNHTPHAFLHPPAYARLLARWTSHAMFIEGTRACLRAYLSHEHGRRVRGSRGPCNGARPAVCASKGSRAREESFIARSQCSQRRPPRFTASQPPHLSMGRNAARGT